MIRALKLLLAGTVFTIGAMAQNNGSTQQFTFSLDGTAIAGCNGEIIDLTGEVHTVIHLSNSSSGQFNAFTHSNYRGVTGVGEETGATYRAHDSFHTHMVMNPDGHTVYSSEESVNLVATGNNAPSTLSIVVIHMVTQPDGTVTANVDHVRSDCK